MVLYECERCLKLFTHRGNFIKHQNNKKKCLESKKKSSKYYYYNICSNNIIKNNIEKQKISPKINNKNNDINFLKRENKVLEKILVEQSSIKRYCSSNYFIIDSNFITNFKHPYSCLIAIINFVHFNEDNEKYQNIKIYSNKNIVSVYNGLIWEWKLKDDFYDDLYYYIKKRVFTILENNCIKDSFKMAYYKFFNADLNNIYNKLELDIINSQRSLKK